MVGIFFVPTLRDGKEFKLNVFLKGVSISNIIHCFIWNILVFEIKAILSSHLTIRIVVRFNNRSVIYLDFMRGSISFRSVFVPSDL